MQLYSESSMSSSSNNSYNFRDAEELKDWRSNIEIPLLDISFNKSRPISPKQVPRKSLPEKETHGRNVAACPVCFNAYDSNQFNPLVLPVCGHTVCETCLYKMEESSSIWKCPVCRACIMQNIRTLPVNYALLEIAERNYHKEYCETHNLEIVGFCKDDGILLCGICIFEHKNHDSFLLTDQRAIEIAKSKESLINK